MNVDHVVCGVWKCEWRWMERMKVTRVRRKNGRLCVAFEIRDSMRFDVCHICHVCRWDLCLLYPFVPCLDFVWTSFGLFPWHRCWVVWITASRVSRRISACAPCSGRSVATKAGRNLSEKISRFLMIFSWFWMILWESTESEKMSHEMSWDFLEISSDASREPKNLSQIRSGNLCGFTMVKFTCVQTCQMWWRWWLQRHSPKSTRYFSEAFGEPALYPQRGWYGAGSGKRQDAMQQKKRMRFVFLTFKQLRMRILFVFKPFFQNKYTFLANKKGNSWRSCFLASAFSFQASLWTWLLDASRHGHNVQIDRVSFSLFWSFAQNGPGFSICVCLGTFLGSLSQSSPRFGIRPQCNEDSISISYFHFTPRAKTSPWCVLSIAWPSWKAVSPVFLKEFKALIRW